MTGILAIETATDACSVALYRDGEVTDIHEVTPRAHSQRLLGMLQELLPDGDLVAAGVDAIAYGCGPGSFTGLRIAASAVQGLAYSARLPAISVSTLACQAQSALRLGLLQPDHLVLSTIDARINEIYAALYSIDSEAPVHMQGPFACPAQQLPLDIAPDARIVAIGSGVAFVPQMPPALQQCITQTYSDLLPAARDLIPLALAQFAAGDVQAPHEVQPIYVRDKISWKKLSEQGPGS
tara:strand:- start:142726 stop:143439 length:714 start_codon:yes stop_codon:yes gene_type:complete